MLMSANAVEATKDEAYAMVLGLKMGYQQLTPENLDSMLLYFAPELPEVALTTEQWVAKAAARRDEECKPLHFLYASGGVIIASDGNRLHRGATALADGYYCAKTFSPVDLDEPFPDTSGIFLDRSALKECKVSKLKQVESVGKRVKTLPYLSVPDESAMVDQSYLKDAFNGKIEGSLFYETTPQEGKSPRLAGDCVFGDWIIAGVDL